jgi:hypothetical protein
MQTNKKKHRQKIGRQIYIGSETEGWADRHTNTDRQKDRQTDKQKDRHTRTNRHVIVEGGQTERQTERRAEGETDDKQTDD